MPRPKVDERSRKRINKACLYCQQTKQKCDGLTPCGKCMSRDRSASCAYSSHERSFGRNRIRQRHAQHRTEPGVGVAEANVSAAGVSGRTAKPPASGQPDRVPEAQVSVPGLSQVLYDNKGQIVYLGNCAALAFLQNIQELIETETGNTADVSNLSVVEELPPAQDGSLITYTTGNRDELSDLVDVFFVSSCGILDLFDRLHIESLLETWVNDQSALSSGHAAVFSLVVACAAQIRSASLVDKLRAQSFYHHGRQLALLELTNNPSIETIQAFTLVSIYMLGCSWRNGASFNLGIAISAAKSLGYHQDHTNSGYSSQERRRRSQIWKTLHYHDLFFSAMMGRSSSTTTDSEQENIYTESDANEDGPCQSLSMTESLRAFLTIERAVNKVYTKKSVSLGVLQSLTSELRDKSGSLPSPFCTTADAHTSSSFRQTQQRNLRNTHVACSYYFAMMLLTRPFLITTLRAKSSRETRPHMHTMGDISSEIAQGALTCIDAATHTVQLLHELLTANMLFKNMLFMVAWTFVSALVLNSAYFSRLDPQRPIIKTLRQAEDILAFFMVNSPQARRYQLILNKLSRAAEDHWQSNRLHILQSRSAHIPRLFQLNPGNSGDSVAPVEPLPGPGENDTRVNRVSGTFANGLPDCTMGLSMPSSESTLVEQSMMTADVNYTQESVLDHATSSEGLFQLDEYSSLWDFSWAGSL